MGKVLIQKYDFIHDENSVVLHDNYSLNRILLITNVTRNQTLYAFNVERLGLQDVIYDYPNNETTLILKTDTTQMDPSDELQIFIEKDYTTFEPSETFLDPVSKLRVSTPSNLIDTDFEYGLQGTKWETIQTVNNIPTIYSSSGDVPIEGVVLVEATNESKQIKVVTTLAHGLSIGDPISVQGVDLYIAEGFFIVSGVADANTFFFEIDEVSDVSGEINGGYTTINAAKFFEGSPLPISDKDGTETDGATPSNILVTTEATHGLAIGTKLYVRNTVGPKNLLIQNTAAIAEDSRPFVDTEPFFTTGLSIDTAANTNRGSFREKPVIGYD